jgi:hypothetical protein
MVQNWAGLCYFSPETWMIEPSLDPEAGFLNGQCCSPCFWDPSGEAGWTF